MTRFALLGLLLLTVGVGCPSNSSNQDAGSRGDSGAPADAGNPFDAGNTPDSGALDGGVPKDGGASVPCTRWVEDARNPLITNGETLTRFVWNDPSVMRQDGGFRMWLSGGDPTTTPIVARLYQATSPDGIVWQISPTPLVSPSTTPTDFDGTRIETPSVIEVSGTFHLYYSGCNGGCDSGVYRIGHATSPDGTTWTKDPANPVIVEQPNSNAWGSGGVSEPGALFNPGDGRIYVYYASQRVDPSRGVELVGILLSTSADGSSFSPYADDAGNRLPVYWRDVAGAPPDSGFGSTTPEVVLDAAGVFHLFTAFAVAPTGLIRQELVSIDHASASDGLHFQVVSQGIVVARDGGWHDQNVIGPAVVPGDGGFEMWFAGDTNSPTYSSGIGLAVCE